MDSSYSPSWEQVMQVAVTCQSITDVEVDALTVPVFEGEKELKGSAAAVDQAMGGALGTLLQGADIAGKPGESAVLYPAGALKARRVVVVGLGKSEDLTVERCRQASGRAARKAQKQGAQSLASSPIGVESGRITPEAAAQASVEGVLMGAYQPKSHKTEAKTIQPITRMTLIAPEEEGLERIEEGVRTGQIFSDAVCTARDLVNQPANHLTPVLLADVARAIAVKEGLTCRVMDKEEMGELKMDAFLSVAKGSKEPPQFIVLEYDGVNDESRTETKEKPVVLVGKGITFDSGGISLKPRAHLEEMKTDMAGAAVVIAVLQAVTRLGLPLKVVALAPACENMPSGGASKPGDVVTAMNGKTIEIVNTDAEGRIILADALCYAARYKPAVVIDVATLTGACVVALGENVAAGIFSPHDDLCERLIASGEFNGEKCWRLPLYEAYKEKIMSDTADIKNTGGRLGGIGASAVFLQEFVTYPWAHIDIAGMALGKNDSPYIPKGGTGFGVRTLLTYLLRYPDQKILTP
jgi:leucyl aminopeptidase